MEVKSLLEQEILNCFRAITEEGNEVIRKEIDEDLIITAETNEYAEVIIRIEGCSFVK